MALLPPSLDAIPYDVFYHIASSLDPHDAVHLSRVNRALHQAMADEPIARNTVLAHFRHTKEGQAATAGSMGYRAAVSRRFDVDEAVAAARPYSASVIAYATTFLYAGGALCYVVDDEIRILDVHGAARGEQVMGISNVLARLLPHHCRGGRLNPVRLSLLHYCDGILALLVELARDDDNNNNNDNDDSTTGGSEEDWLFAIDLRSRLENPRARRLRLRTQLSSTRRLFVRHNRSYLYYGTHSARGYHGFPLWAVHCVDLATGDHLTEKPVQLDHFAGNEIGQTVCFGLHHDHLYAVSTQVDFEEEEVDWTSFYVWFCLAPAPHSRRATTPNRTWRRQHREGPINDTWTDLSLRHDAATQQLMILECRREWRDGGSENCRTYYMQALPSPDELFAGEQKHGDGAADTTTTTTSIPSSDLLLLHKPHLALAKAIDPSSSKPNYEHPKKRLRRHYHSEYQLDHPPSPRRRDFILAKTKYRTYNLSASAFIDLVNDPRPDPDSDPASGSLLPPDRLRLRTVSRKRKCPIDETGDEGPAGLLYGPDQHHDHDHDHDGNDRGTAAPPLEHSEERFVSRGVHLWPPDDAPPELLRLLCPGKRAGRVLAMADDRSLVYSVDHDGFLPDGTQALVLINFDPTIRLPGLTRLHPGAGAGADASTSSSTGLNDLIGHAGVAVDSPCGNRSSMSVVMRSTTGSTQGPTVREEGALYLRIGEGYWLR